MQHCAQLHSHWRTRGLARPSLVLTLRRWRSQAVKEAVLASAASLPPATLISLITFDGAVALHNLGPEHRASYTLPAAFAAQPVPGAGGVAAAPSGGGVVPGAEHSTDQQAVIQQLLDK